jgi:hypothetical protein
MREVSGGSDQPLEQLVNRPLHLSLTVTTGRRRPTVRQADGL